jgi:branched-chain amino acid transport system permease protein
VLAIVLVSRISSSLVGRTFLAIRISDDLAQSLGINLMRNKVLAFVLSTVYAGLAGGLYAGVVRFIGPAEAEVVHTFDIITYLLVGGIGTLMGPLVGTMMITWLTQAVQSFEEYRMIVFGPMLVLLVIFMPKGVVGTFLTWRGRRLASKAPAKEGQTRVGDSATSSKEASDNA